jgi:hypothetical protein
MHLCTFYCFLKLTSLIKFFKWDFLNFTSWSHFQKEAIDITTCDQLSTEVSLDGAARKDIRDFSALISVQKIRSTAGLPRGSVSAIGSPKLIPCSGATSPTNRPQPQLRMAMTPWHNPSSKRSSTVSSPTRARPISGRAQVDGKEFFRLARTRLSYEQFGAFLTIIKELNSHKQSKEETLKKAQQIFGSENRDLYLSFYSLLNRNMWWIKAMASGIVMLEWST